MKQIHVLVLIGAVLVAGCIGYLIGRPQAFSAGTHMMGNGGMMGDNDMEGMVQMMGAMLAGKKGLELDRAFLVAMIPHHQGAVEMCQPILTDSLHEELKALCRDIIQSQTREIEMMKQWQKQW